MDEVISPLILKGQSISHIFTHHKDELDCCERTLYYYFDKNAFTARNIDLPRKVKYKPRKNLHFLQLKNQLIELVEHLMTLLSLLRIILIYL